MSVSSPAPDPANLVIVTPVEEDLAADIRARIYRQKLFPIDVREMLKQLYEARDVERRVADDKPLSTALLRCTPVPVVGGILNEEAAWQTVCPEIFQLPDARPDAVGLLRCIAAPANHRISPDWVVQYGTRWLQIEREGQKTIVRSGATVLVREHRDGSVSIWLKKTKLPWHELMERPKKAKPAPPAKRSRTKWSPPENHPWREQLRPALRLRAAVSGFVYRGRVINGQTSHLHRRSPDDRRRVE